VVRELRQSAAGNAAFPFIETPAVRTETTGINVAYDGAGAVNAKTEIALSSFRIHIEFHPDGTELWEQIARSHSRWPSIKSYCSPFLSPASFSQNTKAAFRAASISETPTGWSRRSAASTSQRIPTPTLPISTTATTCRRATPAPQVRTFDFF